MRRGSVLIIAACVVVGTARGHDPGQKDDDAAKKDLALLQGTWVIVAKEYKGKQATKEEVAELTGVTVIKDNKKTEWTESLGKKSIISEATFKLDPKAKPKAIDFFYSSGPVKEKSDLAIYEVTQDTLRVCYSLEDGKRPTEFAGKADGNAVLLTFKRVKK
jgi:uncharacterized protein (TIGR03067 family)